MATQDSPSLYERLGGVYSIATVVDDLIDRVMADPRLNANPLVDDAHHKVPPAGFKYLVTEMLFCPQKYTGKDMESSHRHLRITPGEWDAFMRRGADARQVRSPGGRAGRGRGHR
jgi:hemoglobin